MQASQIRSAKKSTYKPVMMSNLTILLIEAERFGAACTLNKINKMR